MILTQKIIWEPINCDIFLEKVYVRLNENGHNVSINLRPEKQATLRRTWLPLASAVIVKQSSECIRNSFMSLKKGNFKKGLLHVSVYLWHVNGTLTANYVGTRL